MAGEGKGRRSSVASAKSRKRGRRATASFLLRRFHSRDCPQTLVRGENFLVNITALNLVAGEQIGILCRDRLSFHLMCATCDLVLYFTYISIILLILYFIFV